MVVESLKLNKFRNHHYLTFAFEPGLNIITGKNAVGKTNMVEAIHYLSLGHSFRTNEILDLIKKDEDQSKIECVIKEGELSRKIVAVLTKDGHKISINSKPIKKLSELSRCVNVILFEPKDVLLFRGSPKERRNFLDISLSKSSPSYLE